MQIDRIPVTDRTSWLALRMQDVTASDVPAVCGIDPYRGALRVWAEKTGAIAPQEDNDTLRRGRWLEAAVIEAMRDRHPTWDLRRAGVYLRDPGIRLGATPDAVATDPEQDGIITVQCKTVRRSVFEQTWSTGADGEPVAPLYNQVQTLTETMMVGAARGVVAALVIDAGGGVELVEAPIARHEAAEARIRATVARFWAEVEAGRQPLVDFGKDGGVVAALYPKGGAEPIDLTTHARIAMLCEERLAWAARRTASDKALDVIDAEITALLGHADRGLHPTFNITWKAQKTGGYAVPPGETRVLRITRKGALS